MRLNKASIFSALGIALLCFILNGALFTYFYNHLATPFLTEEQRVINAEYIMSVTVGGYATSSIIIGIAVLIILGARK